MRVGSIQCFGDMGDRISERREICEQSFEFSPLTGGFGGGMERVEEFLLLPGEFSRRSDLNVVLKVFEIAHSLGFRCEVCEICVYSGGFGRIRPIS